MSRKEFEFKGRIFTLSDYYKYIDGKIYRNAVAGLIAENKRPYRKAGNYDIYIDSFPRAALPYSKYYIADKRSGNVYETEVVQGLTNNKQYLSELVEELKRR